jgi:cytochrome P450
LRGERFDLLEELRLFTVDVSTGLAFGVDLNTIESSEQTIQVHLRDIFRMTQKRLFAPFPYWHWVRMPEDRRLEQSFAVLRAAIGGFIAQARTRMAREPRLLEHPGNLLEAMVATRDRPGSGFTDDDVHGNVMTMLIAGEDTTANTLAWTMHLLHLNPQAALMARKEVDEVLGADELPTSDEQLARLDVVEACTAESMRLHPVAPLIVVEALRDTVVGDVAVPKGTQVMIQAHSASEDEASFEDPGAFRPERWIAGEWNAQLSSARRSVMPFGAGPRMCPGRYLALIEMKMLLAMLLRNFELVDISGARGAAVRERLAFTMGPAELEAVLANRAEG